MPWELTGNMGTNPPTDFLGTTDGQPLIVKTSGTERVRVGANGKVGVGIMDPASQLSLGNNSGIRQLVWDGDRNNTQDVNCGFGINLAGAGSSLDIFISQLYGLNIVAPTGPWPYPGYSAKLTVLPNGNVGIGTPQPTSSLEVNGDLTVTGAGLLTVTGTYNNPGGIQNFNYSVAIGVGAPNSVLAVSASAPGVLGPVIALTNTGGGINAAAAIDFYTFDPGEGVGPDHSTSPSSRIEALDDGNFANDIVFLSNEPGAPNNALVERMRITNTGNVKVPGDILLTGADCAEQFDVGRAEPQRPGTVVVIGEDGALRESRDAYDRKVVGVVSGAGDYRHGILLDQRPQSEGRVAVALLGKVYCKVDAQYSPIHVGDLLTTSPTAGHAMKAIEPHKAFGAVIGKALKSLAEGSGLIPIIIALQ